MRIQLYATTDVYINLSYIYVVTVCLCAARPSAARMVISLNYIRYLYCLRKILSVLTVDR